jgi:predicted DNA-binding transcriptional regulator AlpA
LEFTLEVDTVAATLVRHELFGGARTATLPGGAVLELRDHIEQRDAQAIGFLELALSLASGVASSLVASWLYEKLSKRTPPLRLRINRTEVRFDKGEIERVIREQIELHEGDDPTRR